MSDLICDLASKGLHHYGKVCGCDPQEQPHSAYQSVYHSSFCYPCAACYGCTEDEYEAGSPFPEEDGQPAQTVLQFYGGAQWGKPDNYDLCINSASYGINETENLILKLLNDQIH